MTGENSLIKSMTGYARTQSENEAYTAVVELRSVNHRYLDVKVRAPSSVASLETKIRDRVTARLGRGKVDVSVQLKPKGESAYQLEVDRPLVEEIVRTGRSLASELGVEGEIKISDLLTFGRAFSMKERDLSATDQAWQALLPALEQALEEHDLMRHAEGAELKADLDRRLADIAEHLDAVENLTASSREQKRRDLLDKINELKVGSLEPTSLAMEVARLVERSDIAEEITRFRSHLSLWNEAVRGEGIRGKKLDFIVQEMGREVNTIGAKCQDADIAERVISIKSELERVREQVQNIE